jgi:molybdopterin synthase sulfur carrier subunit
MNTVVLEFSGTLVSKAGMPAKLPIHADSIQNALEQLAESHPATTRLLTDDLGNLKKFVNVFVDDVDMRMLAGTQTRLTDSERVSFHLAVAGG